MLILDRRGRQLGRCNTRGLRLLSVTCWHRKHKPLERSRSREECPCDHAVFGNGESANEAAHQRANRYLFAPSPVCVIVRHQNLADLRSGKDFGAIWLSSATTCASFAIRRPIVHAPVRSSTLRNVPMGSFITADQFSRAVGFGCIVCRTLPAQPAHPTAAATTSATTLRPTNFVIETIRMTSIFRLPGGRG
jgi:hypothetical protein